MPSDSGVTSSRRTSFTSPRMTPAWMAAPTATTSSGLTPLCGSLPSSSVTFSCTAGMRVMPPTSTTCSMSDAVEPGVGDHLLRRADRPLEQVRRQLEQLRARELHVEVLRALGDERQVDLRRHRRGELDLRLLGGVVEPLERDRVLREVGAVVLLELRDEPVDDGLVEVVAAEVVVARRRLHVERPVAELEHGHVERAAAEVEDEDRLVGLLVEAVRERGGRRLVDDAEDVEAGDLAGVLRRLALGVVEVRGDGDDGVRDLLAEVRLRVRLELLEDHRARSPAARTPCRPPSRARPRSGPS